MSEHWYYADRSGQQQGPVDAEWLRAALQRGEIAGATLVWRDGLPEWLPLSQLAAELGVVGVGGPPPIPPGAPRAAVVSAGGRPVAVAPKGGGVGLVVVIVIIGVVVIAFGGILAAIAIPAYHDYTLRAKVANALYVTEPIKMQIIETLRAEERCVLNGEAGIGEAESYAGPGVREVIVGTLESNESICALQLVVTEVGGVVQDGSYVTMMLQPDGSWQYDTDIPKRYLPASIRDSVD